MSAVNQTGPEQLPEYELIRSRRRSIGLRLRPDGVLEVRAPLRCSKREIERVLREKQSWILRVRARTETARAEAESAGVLTAGELRALAERARQVLPERTAYFASLIGVTYGNITIRAQRTRWGSCSGKGNLNFNCLLMLAPPEVRDAVVVHELCHRREMNHSARFYEEVRRVLPDYDLRRAWLKDHGRALLARLPEKP